MAQYVITGASGHIGNNLVRLINRLEPSSEVTVLSRRPIRRELEGTHCEQVMGDLGNCEFLCNLIRSDHIVIHLAGLIDLTDTRAEDTYRVNVEYTRLLCDVCREKQVARFVYVGSVDAIDKSGGVSPLTEPAEYYPDRIAGHYGKSKALAAQYVLNAVRTDPTFNAAIVLPSAVIGTHDYKPSAVGAILRDCLNGKPEFGIRGGYNFVDVQDVCRVIYTLAWGNQRDQYIVCGTEVSVRELYETVNRLACLPQHPLILPTRLVRFFLPFIRVLNPITLKALQEPHNYSCQKAINELAFSPTPFEDTILQIVAEFRQNSLLSPQGMV